MMKRMLALMCGVLLCVLAVCPVMAEPDTVTAVHVKAYRMADKVCVQLVDTEGQNLAAELPVDLWINGEWISTHSTDPTGFVFFDTVSVEEQDIRIMVHGNDLYLTEGLVEVTDTRLTFDFEEGERTYANNKLSIAWNPSEGASIKAIFGTTEILPEDGTVSPAVFDVSSLMPDTLDVLAHYSVKYVISEGPAEVTVDGTPFVMGSLSTFITMEKGSGNNIKATLVDINGDPLAGVSLTFRLGSNPAKTGTTNELGECVFQGISGADPNKTVVSFAGTQRMAIKYGASTQNLSMSYTRPTTTTTTTGSTTDPSSTTTMPGDETNPSTQTTPTPPTTTTTLPINTTVTGLGTTIQQQNQVIIGATYDTVTLSGFGISSSAMTSGARMILSPTYYAQLVSNGMPLLSLKKTASTVTVQQLKEASRNVPQLSEYTEDQIRFVAFDLQLAVISADGTATAVPLFETVTICLPVPETMKNAEHIAVARDNGAMTIVPVQNGIIKFNIESGDSYTVIGYGEKAVVADQNKLPWGRLILLGSGLLLLIAAIIILCIFLIRKNKSGGNPPRQKTVSPVSKVPEQEKKPFSVTISEGEGKDPFRSQHVEKNSIVDDLPLLQREQMRKSKNATDFNVDL